MSSYLTILHRTFSYRYKRTDESQRLSAASGKANIVTLLRRLLRGVMFSTSPSATTMSKSVLPPMPTLPTPPAAKMSKLGGYDFFRSIGSPKYVVAPMVDQSELAWRMLSRSPLPPAMAGPSSAPTAEVPYTRHQGGATLCYTPMIHAKVFSEAKQLSKGGDGYFDLTHGEEGSADTVAGIEGGDRPLVVQFCANDPEILLAAAKKVQDRCDAVDINFGCPQGIAKRGHYGSFLQDDWELIKSLIGTLHENLAVPVTAKFRIFPDKERTVAYARMMEAAGAQIITCHGRTREMKGQLTGMADWEMIKAVKEAVNIPVFANGNILYAEDVEKCLEVTGCDGVMSAEGNLSNPALFVPPNHPHAHPPVTVLAHRYLDIVASLKTRTSSSAVRAHLFRMLKSELDRDNDLRDKIAKAKFGTNGEVDGFREVISDIEAKVQPEVEAAGPSWRPPPIDPETGYRSLPTWSAQPYIRPAPVSAKVDSGLEGLDPEVAMNAVAGSSPPTANSRLTCVSISNQPCPSIAALRCPTGACLTHCRQIRAIEGGMDPTEAEAKSKTGELAGRGCEAHESKVAARQERQSLKRKAFGEAKKLRKVRKTESKAILREQAHARGRRDEEEEEALSNGIKA